MICPLLRLPPEFAALPVGMGGGLSHRIATLAAPMLMPFAAVYLLMVFFGFVFGERQVLWLRPVEAVLQRAGRLPNLAVILALVLVVCVAEAGAGHRTTVLLSGLAGLSVYLLVNGAAKFFPAFTVRLVRRGVIAEYVHLEHGAHWAIGALALSMLLRLDHPTAVSSRLTGLIGVAFIAAAFLSSLRARRHVPAHARRSRAFRLRDRRQPIGVPVTPTGAVRRGLFSALAVTGLTAATLPAFVLLVRTASPEIEVPKPSGTPTPIVLPSPTIEPSTSDALTRPSLLPRSHPLHARRRWVHLRQDTPQP